MNNFTLAEYAYIFFSCVPVLLELDYKENKYLAFCTSSLNSIVPLNLGRKKFVSVFTHKRFLYYNNTDPKCLTEFIIFWTPICLNT